MGCKIQVLEFLTEGKYELLKGVELEKGVSEQTAGSVVWVIAVSRGDMGDKVLTVREFKPQLL